MRRRLIRSAVVAGLLLLIGGSILVTRYRASVHQQGLETSLKWARLAPLPVPLDEVTVTTEGSMFTLAFRICFVASASDIQRWLAESPGTCSILPETNGNIQRYGITPGGGAQHAELTVDLESGEVRIYVYWS